MKKTITTLIIISAITGIYFNFNHTPSTEKTAPEIIKGKVIKAGLFKVIRSGGLVNSANTSTGKAIAKPVIQMIKATNRIPLIKDAHMSLQYRIWNLPEKVSYIKLKRVLKHPTITLPDGTTSTGSEYMITGKVSIGQVIAYTGYGLNEDYEMQAGDWTFQIWYDNKKLIEQTFTTYLPDEKETQQWNERLSRKKVVAADKKKSTKTKSVPANKTQKGQTAAKRKWLD